MAVIQPKQHDVRGGGGVTVAWSLMADGDVGGAMAALQYLESSFQIEGEFGVGGRCHIEGSNDGVNFHALNDAMGAPLVVASAGIVRPVERVLFVRPRVASKGKAAITVIAVLSGLR